MKLFRFGWHNSWQIALKIIWQVKGTWHEKFGEPELKQIEIVIHPTLLFFGYYLGVNNATRDHSLLKMGFLVIEPLQRQHMWHLIFSVQWSNLFNYVNGRSGFQSISAGVKMHSAWFIVSLIYQNLTVLCCWWFVDIVLPGENVYFFLHSILH